MNIVIYARYSSRSQTEQSIEGQLQICYEFAKNNSRAEFQRMISDSDKHSFEGVLVYQLVMIKITALQRQADWLSQQLRLTRAQRFGASSERTQALSERFALFNETEAVALPDAAEPDLEQITYKRKKRKGKRETDFSSLPTEQVIHELPEEERICPERGGSLRECGHAVLGRKNRLFSNTPLRDFEIPKKKKVKQLVL